MTGSLFSYKVTFKIKIDFIGFYCLFDNIATHTHQHIALFMVARRTRHTVFCPKASRSAYYILYIYIYIYPLRYTSMRCTSLRSAHTHTFGKYIRFMSRLQTRSLAGRHRTHSVKKQQQKITIIYTKRTDTIYI